MQQDSIWSRGYAFDGTGNERTRKNMQSRAIAVRDYSSFSAHVDSKLDVIGCLLFDPIDPLLAVCGREGAVKILDYRKRGCVSAFHATGE